MRQLALAAAGLTLAISASADGHANLEGVSSGAYILEKNHAYLTFSVKHSGGLSDYVVNFTRFNADLNFNPENPEESSISVSIDPLSLVTYYPGDYKAGHADSPYATWDEDVARNPKWLNADAFPEILFTSTEVTKTGDHTGTVTGDLSFLGTSKPVTMNVTYNGSGNAPWFGERDLIGFTAETKLNRSDFGMTRAIPSVSDEVTIRFSGEFLQAAE